jgi:hypothetical protein
VAVAVLALGLVVGRVARADNGPPPAAKPVAPATRELRVFFLRGEKLTVVHRVVPITLTPAARSLRLLLAGPSAVESRAGATTAIPAGSSIRWLIRRGNVANVNLSSDFAPGAGSSSARRSRRSSTR